MKKLIIILFLFFPCRILAQDELYLAEFDSFTHRLITESDKNKYDYDFPTWITLSTKLFTDINDSIITNYDFKSLHKIRIESYKTTIFYFIKNRNVTTTFNWIAKPDGGEAISFCDAFHTNQAQKLVISERVIRDQHGIEIKDSLTENQLFWVPDVEARMLFEILADTHSPINIKERASEKIDIKLNDMFYTDEATILPTNGYPRLFVVDNESNTIRVASYMITYPDFTSRCSGFVIHKNNTGSIVTEKLIDKSSEIKSEERIKTKTTNWYGAVYTSLIEVEISKQKYYVLLGYKSSDSLVKTRVIDLLWFKRNQCNFGAPLFLHEKATYHRRVFKYSAEANMLLRYDKQHQRIVFDHLSPTNTMFTGEYRFYGPDFSYDAYLITKDGFKFKEDVDFRQEQKK